MALYSFLFALVVLFCSYLVLIVVWPFILALVGSLMNNGIATADTIELRKRILVLIPAYKEDVVVVDTAKNAAGHNYPKDLFRVCVIADQLKSDTLRLLRETSVDVIEVEFENSTKAKALNFALSHYSDAHYDIAVVLDADNHMEPGFLVRIAHVLSSGYRAVQGRRAAKNNNSSMAILDGLSEDANNVIYGAGQFGINCSSRLSGSGMAFDFRLFKEAMRDVHAINGFDKELELLLVRKGVQIAYDHKAAILDEKVASAEAFQHQRTRWLAAQYFFLRVNTLKLFTVGAGERPLDYVQKILILAIPPRVLVPVILVFGLGLSLASGSPEFIWLFIGLLLLNICMYLLAIPGHYFKSPYRQRILALPVAMLHTLLAVFKMRRARGKFIHTIHGSTEKTA